MKHFEPYYKTPYGAAYCADSLEFMQSLPDASVNLCLTSPPFALAKGSEKHYGNVPETEYVDWLLQFTKEIKRILKTNGSFILDLGTTYLQGLPVKSLVPYKLICRLVEEQGWCYCQDLYHFNKTSIPAGHHVTVKKVRLKNSTNLVFWLSPTPYPFTNLQAVLQPYSKNTLKRMNGYEIKQQKHPSGHSVTNKFYVDRGGSIPSNMLMLSNAESNSKYLNALRQNNILIHPARFPRQFPEHFIKMLTVEGQTVMDCFGGSGTTGYVAETLKRNWITCEQNEQYVIGSKFRFTEFSDN